MICAFSFFKRSHSLNHCSSVKALIVGTATVFCSQSAASPPIKTKYPAFFEVRVAAALGQFGVESLKR